MRTILVIFCLYLCTFAFAGASEYSDLLIERKAIGERLSIFEKFEVQEVAELNQQKATLDESYADLRVELTKIHEAKRALDARKFDFNIVGYFNAVRAYNTLNDNYIKNTNAYHKLLENYENRRKSLDHSRSLSEVDRDRLKAIDARLAQLPTGNTDNTPVPPVQQSQQPQQTIAPAADNISLVSLEQKVASLQAKVDGKFALVTALHQGFATNTTPDYARQYDLEMITFNSLKNELETSQKILELTRTHRQQQLEQRRIDKMALLQAQLTERREVDETRTGTFAETKSLILSPSHCDEYNKIYPNSPDGLRTKQLGQGCYVTGKHDGDRLIGFDFTNFGSPNTNKLGNYQARGSYRQFSIQFPSKSDMKFVISDNAQLSGRDSHDNMVKSIVFIPRVIEPYMENNGDESTLYLPTGESVVFDTITKEIKRGALSELPIDRSSDRSTRSFARIKYHGKGLTIETSRRGESPEYTHTESWNVNEDRQNAIVKYKGKECRIRKSHLWEGTFGVDGVEFQFPSDEDLLFQMINPLCNWNLKLSDLKGE